MYMHIVLNSCLILIDAGVSADLCDDRGWRWFSVRQLHTYIYKPMYVYNGAGEQLVLKIALEPHTGKTKTMSFRGVESSPGSPSTQ